MKCKFCGAEIPNDASFCSECGAFTSFSETPPVPEPPKPEPPNIEPTEEYSYDTDGAGTWSTCEHCGTEVRSGTSFCPNCGSRVKKNMSTDDAGKWTTCSRCGSEVREGKAYCPNCGNRIEAVTPPGDEPKPVQNNKLLIAIATAGGVLLIAALIVIAVLVANNMDSQSSPTPTPTPTPTASPTPTPKPTPTPTPRPTPTPTLKPMPTPQPIQQETSAVSNPSYTRFSNSEYGFSINYPSHFKAYNDGGTITLHTVESPDKQAREIIAAIPANGETVDSSYNSYVSGHSGSIEYQNKGSDFYAINILSGNTEYYKYCKFANGNIYWFEFISPHSQHEIYDKYINDIYQSINITGASIKK